MPTIEYTASPTLSDFHRSEAFVRGIRGPVGSGKSTGCSWELWRRANEQHKAPDGKRYTRWAVVRNTYGELRDTTLKTWLDWFSEDKLGPVNRQEMTHHIQYGDLDMEVMFRALDRPQDIKKVLSLELTGAWVNEAREVPKGIVDALGDRTGRYPSIRNGGCTWRGVLLDTNSPDSDHWWYRLAEEDRPEGWEFFSQPGGLIEVNGKWITNPQAENLHHLEPRYYETRWPGKSRDYISVYYANLYGFSVDGKPVYPEYEDAAHAAKEVLAPDPKRTLYVGIDYGLTPAAAFGQRTVTGQWRWIDELVTENMGAVAFAGVLGPLLRGTYKHWADNKLLEIYGDPTGDTRAQTDETTPAQILQARGIPVMPAPSNDPIIRREAVAMAMTRKDGFLISPKCKVLRKGLAGGYHYKRIQVVGDERFHDEPNKNRFSHVCDGQQYAALGAGEGERVIPVPKAWGMKLDYSKISKGVV